MFPISTSIIRYADLNLTVGHMAAACPKAGTPSCYNCGADGHISKDCSSAPVPKNCYNCGESGHITLIDLPFIDAYNLVSRAVIVLNSIMVTPVVVVAAVAETVVVLNAINVVRLATSLALALKLAKIQVGATEAIINQDAVVVATTVSTTVTVVEAVPPNPATHVVEWAIYLETAFKHKNASIAVKSVTSVEIAPNPNQRPVTTLGCETSILELIEAKPHLPSQCGEAGHISKDCPTAPSGDTTAA
ncbi:uncharacterized protein MELLADRAFT_110161 [Melampsora larici-populina 98AG31]|uniref:CCHC-type domain-containing protein n=1 Tax=Melampsora larici-populina (strain 98AG31 / pathotype 3-4-7) TaxID=747676 RepID=F4RYW0_MELLP|nr:uncharacterized protein MELLADRAFT_110161 [Melampsora larici-populina 98AG31]EGG02316.1 hypothetical protein MELLADRAFT_110161 [Melampsora larici-populina 98AG31]